MKKKKKCDNRSAGVLLYDDLGKIYLIERMKEPYGWAPPAGHVDNDGTDYRAAAKRETMEEVGIKVKKITLLLSRTFNNKCRRRGGDFHRWQVFRAKEWGGKPKRSKKETKDARWFTPDEVKVLAQRSALYLRGKVPEKEWEKNPGIEIVWYKIFKLLKII